MGGMFLSEGLDIKFGDFKTCVLLEAYSRVPDSLVRNIAGSPLAVGEFKVPWVPLHKIRDTLSNRDGRFRWLIGKSSLTYGSLDMTYGI